ncbi:MAG: YbhB/YbcL family Raf kinase inhibitor-like protein [Gammaproteobacteria bacterium]|jgi:Raf kinase inhibitor-like YbhB/YbcL family protein|nr:YbhB/YbcL family Raf kinase inhibitor-like protein [Gammaproteobacteria bacterium]
MDMTIESPAFEHNGEIPAVYTCDGRDISPELRWSGVPEDAKSLVLIVDDPDAPDPDAPKMTWVHWVLYDIPAAAVGLPADVAPDDLPNGTRHGTNNWERTGYGGPCPPIGRHRYFFKLYALDKELGNLGGPTSDEITEAMEDHVLADAQLIGTYSRE